VTLNFNSLQLSAPHAIHGGPGWRARVEKALEGERDHLPLWIPVGIGIGIAIWQNFGDSAALAVTAMCTAVIMLGFAIGGGQRLSLLLKAAALTVFAGFAVIMLKSSLVASPVLAKIWIGEFYGRIAQVEKLTAREIIRIRLETGGHQSLPRSVRVNLAPSQYHEDFQPGAVIRVRARLMPPAGPALPGGYDFARRAWFQGIGATGSALGEVILHRPSPYVPVFSDGRARLTDHVRNSMPIGTGAIGAALVTGDQGHINEADAQAMRDSGLAHLLSISGLHVTAVVGFIFLAVSRSLALLPWFALRFPVPLIAASAAALGAVGYTLLAGAEVPTVRSCIAALLVLAALALGRDALTLRLVAFGALVVLLFWPEAMAGPSFQLSFAAVATIVILHDLPWMKRLAERREENWVWRILRGVASLILTGIAIELILAPIALYHFHKTGLYGALANVVAIPLTTFLIMPFEALALLFDVAGLGAPFWWIAGQGVALILYIAHGVSSLPGAVSVLPAMPDWGFGAIIAGALICGLLRSRARLWGILPFSVGIAAMVLAPRPDMLITGDGKHLALVSAGGEIALLRSGAGDYVRSMLLENAGTNREPVAIENWPGVKCSADNCIFDIERSGRRWQILATRTRYPVPSMEMAAACRRVDIVVSDRWLPRNCQPRWFKADRHMLDISGGLAIYFPSARIDRVNDDNAHKPWVKAARAARTAAPQVRTDIVP
jgi:competence protein ComEC